MSYWDELGKKDLVGKLLPLFTQGKLFIDPEDNKIKRPNQVMLINNPWIFIKTAEWTNCALWHQVYFNQLKIIHSACFECFKVVVRPETVKELFAVYDVMQNLDLHSKCGIELRDTIGKLYGAYFYCHGLEKGKQTYRTVKKAMDEKIRPDMDIILKRGCSEFEQLHGDSSKYEQKGYDKEIEELLEANSDIPVLLFTQPEIVKTYIKRMWLAWAWKNNDKTCLEFNDGKAFIAQPVTYHEDVKEN